jgi:hypothetical protein
VKHRKSQLKTKKVNPPYPPNGDSVGEFLYIIGFKTLEMGG